VDTRGSRILTNHAARTLLALNMHLLYLILVLVPHVSARAGTVPPDTLYPYPTLIAASILGLRTLSRLLLITPSRPMQSDNLCIAWSLPGNRRARSGFEPVSSAISCGLNILFRCGLFYCRCVPATWSVPSGRSNITSHYRPQAVQSLPLPR